ncbi:site-specific integrase [Vibrio alginolyticus]|uniref:site-specific integrase n=1 Tax=Vibrio alginolyticus TaxID=663 RepID=UPI00384F6859
MLKVNDKDFNKHWIYVDDDNVPILFPCLYARYTSRSGLTVELKSKKNRLTNTTDHFFQEDEIGSDGQYIRQNQLGLFLEWVDNEHKSGSCLSLISHTACPQDIINEYINTYLIENMEKSEVVAERAVYSLRSYYNWLHYFFDNRYKKIGIFPSHRALARANNKQGLLVKYLLPATRELLYRHTETLLEELILRNGGELGCRTKENQGFLLNDFTVNKKRYSGVLSLFNELDKNPEKDEFEYHLSSLYTKYGTSRKLYISREHLRKMKRYYDQERPFSDSEHLYVSNSSNSSRGNVLSTQYGSDTFRKIVNIVHDEMKNNPDSYVGYQVLEEGHVYHHLRHSFGTDIFYDECRKRGKNIESITTESSVYIETARRLGHKVDGVYDNQTTKTYIHSCGHRERLMEEVVYG